VIGRNKPPSRDRTPEERAAAAAERAARRGATGDNPVLPPQPEPVPEPRPEPKPIPRPDPEPLPEPEPAPAPEPEPTAVERAPEPSPRPLPPRPPGRRPLPPRPGDAKTRRARPAPDNLPPASGEPSHWGRRVLALLALVVVGGALWLIYSTFQPGKADGRGAVAVTIPPGSDAGKIGDILVERGVVENATFFNLNATLTGRRGKLKSGDYTFAQDMSNGDALDALVQGPKAKIVKTFSFTIPEGRTRREVVPLVKKAEFEGDYLKATQSAAALRRARRLGLPRSSKNPEGFLFPSTYELLVGATSKDLVERQLQTFAEQMKEVDMAAAKRRNLSRYDVVIIASMVEREAQLDKERPLVAAVIHNRLREGMPLGIDATIRYFENNWTSPLKVSELERDSPYNTRKRKGLPPTPIGNPGLASLKAAAKPSNRDFLFYVVKPGKCGEHAFSSTDAQFAKDVARYNAARDEAGGKSPTTC
jgi:uncharacterized YceG family protein